jgi:hypothetical protein
MSFVNYLENKILRFQLPQLYRTFFRNLLWNLYIKRSIIDVLNFIIQFEKMEGNYKAANCNRSMVSYNWITVLNIF